LGVPIVKILRPKRMKNALDDRSHPFKVKELQPFIAYKDKKKWHLDDCK